MSPTTAQVTEKKNQEYFSKNLETYRANVAALDTYQRQRAVITALIDGSVSLVDIGNGGVFEYDTTVAQRIVAIDLFMDGIPRDAGWPSNVAPVQASVLDLSAQPQSEHDTVLMVMLLHHLTGKTVAESRSNVATALRESAGLLKPGGRMIIIESTVPRWFYAFESLVYRPAAWLIDRLISHPATLQYTVKDLERMLPAQLTLEHVEVIPKGRWILQFGLPFPGWLTPAQPVAMVLRKKP